MSTYSRILGLFVFLHLFALAYSIPPQFHALHSNRNAGTGINADMWPADVPGWKFSTTTAVPLICLMEWDSPRCREHAFNVPAPKFAPNFKFPQDPIRNTETTDSDTG